MNLLDLDFQNSKTHTYYSLKGPIDFQLINTIDHIIKGVYETIKTMNGEL